VKVGRLAFGVWRSAFGDAVSTSVTLMGQEIVNNTVSVDGLILSSPI
jgi:hypothetical protein